MWPLDEPTWISPWTNSFLGMGVVYGEGTI